MKKLILFIGFIILSLAGYAQLSYTGSDLEEDFELLDATMTNGGLDQSQWQFMRTVTLSTTTFVGNTDEGTTIGGIYEFTNGANKALYIQPTGSEFTPGMIILNITNNSGDEMTGVNVDYDILSYNDQNRSNTFNFLYSIDDGTTFLPVSSVDFETAETEETTPILTVTERNVLLAGVTIADGANLILKWAINDNGGSGSRDEIGLDNVEISADPIVLPPVEPIPTMGQWALFILALITSSLALGFMATTRRIKA